MNLFAGINLCILTYIRTTYFIDVDFKRARRLFSLFGFLCVGSVCGVCLVSKFGFIREFDRGFLFLLEARDSFSLRDSNSLSHRFSCLMKAQYNHWVLCLLNSHIPFLRTLLVSHNALDLRVR
uniref:CSON004969 protein n=1 Tax=Culicoides sonorensis TaxID=179676 RepID=A0A336LUC7_CULSO